MIHKSSIKYNLQSEFHMLRHFENTDTSSFESLLDNGYSQHQIHHELKIAGSKFFAFFANDINALFTRVLTTPYVQSKGINGNNVLESVFSQEEFPNGIGTKAVVSIDEIPEEQRAGIFYEKNRNYSLAHLYVNKLPMTNHCTMILKPVKTGYSFITAFPGQSAMPVPDNKMANAQFDACKSFWEKHVFLKLI